MIQKSLPKEFVITVGKIEETVDYIAPVNSSDDMDKVFTDSYVTKQQRARDIQITNLLEQYVQEYEKKNKSKRLYKQILFWSNIITIWIFCGIFLLMLVWINVNKRQASLPISDLIEIITVCITFLTLIVSLLKIITKYVFPQNEEEYITRIVEIIQKNDLENKKENIRASREIIINENNRNNLDADSNISEND